jgi:microcystin degradation protein MlrC
VGETEVIVSSLRRQVLDPEILLLHGLVPGRYDLIAVKSAHHFRSGFAGVGRAFLAADSPGLTSLIPATRKEERTGEPNPGDRQPAQRHAADLSGAR